MVCDVASYIPIGMSGDTTLHDNHNTTATEGRSSVRQLCSSRRHGEGNTGMGIAGKGGIQLGIPHGSTGDTYNNSGCDISGAEP